MLHHVAWFTEAPIAPCPEGGLTTTDEMVRRRCLMPAREMEKLGILCSVFGNLHDADPAEVCQTLEKLDVDVVVIGRMSEPSLLRLAKAAKHHGCYVVADFDDANPMTEDALELATVADQIVAATPEAAAKLFKPTGLKALIIPDCGLNDGPSADTIAHMWHEGLKKLKVKPPACANTNVPERL